MSRPAAEESRARDAGSSMPRHLRSNFAETSEAIFLTQGHVYDSAEQCEARFKGEDEGFIYARFSNPTVGDVRGAHGGARRGGSGARHRDRHGGGDGLAPRPAARRRPRRRGAPGSSAPAASSARGPSRPASASAQTLVEARSSTSSTSPASPRSRANAERSSSSTTCSRRRSGSTRSRSAPTAWSIPRRSTSTGRGGASGA